MQLEQVWQALEEGKTVYWTNKSYKITIEPLNREWRESNGFEIPFSAKGEQCLRVTCISNWFGSLLDPSELNSLFVE